jgi:uracil permease
MKVKQDVIGYLPDESPSFLRLLILALQQIIVMFPATVLVALYTGFHVSTTIFASGLATLCFIFITKRKIPLYYGSSFSYIAAISAITLAEYGETASDLLIGKAQFGIIMSGLVSIVVGLILKKVKFETIEKVLPATVTGSVALIIGLSLSATALNNASDVSSIVGVTDASLATNLSWVIALVTLFTTIFFSVYLKKGIWSQIPILLGLIIGYVTALIIGWSTGIQFVNFGLLNTKDIFQVPHFTLPVPSLEAVLAIMPIAIATIPESTAHLYQLDIYVNNLANERGVSDKYNIADKLGLNLIGDGLGDMISAAIGGPAGTNYGENLSTMSITRNFSVNVLISASIITMIISFFTPLSSLVYSIPGAVIGGLSIYLFGVIAAQGIAIMIEKKVDLFSSKHLAIIAIILIVGLGGSFNFPNGMIPLFGFKAPAIATAAIMGIIINLLFNLFDSILRKKEA